MRLASIQVESYAGARADETPRRFRWEGRLVEVDHVLDRWRRVGREPESPRVDYFRVLGADQREYLLEHDLESDDWHLAQDRRTETTDVT